MYFVIFVMVITSSRTYRALSTWNIYTFPERLSLIRHSNVYVTSYITSLISTFNWTSICFKFYQVLKLYQSRFYNQTSKVRQSPLPPFKMEVCPDYLGGWKAWPDLEFYIYIYVY